MIYPIDKRCQSAHFLSIIALPGRTLNPCQAKYIWENTTILVAFLLFPDIEIVQVV